MKDGDNDQKINLVQITVHTDDPDTTKEDLVKQLVAAIKRVFPGLRFYRIKGTDIAPRGGEQTDIVMGRKPGDVAEEWE